MTVYFFERKVYPGFGRWVIANFLFSMGYFTISLRDTTPPFFSIVVGNSLLVYSEILVFEGIELFFGRAPFSRFNYFVLLLYTIVQYYLTYISPSVNLRVILISIALIILIVRAGLALLNPTIPRLSKTSRSAAAIFFVTALVPFLRTIYTLMQSSPIDLKTDVMGAWASIAIIIAISAWSFYYFFLTSARLELELQQAREEMVQFATTDALTELYNRRYFLERSEGELRRARREGRGFSLIFVDLDNLKLLNDKFGHGAGDAVLTTVSGILKNEVRLYDLAARFGGDEFVLLLCNVNKEQAASVAERIRVTAEQCSLMLNSQPIPIRLSLGVSSLEEQDTEINQILQRADVALYKAKNEGRNRVAIS